MGTDIDCFECLVCGYIYDPEAGDPVGGIPSGGNFLSLPETGYARNAVPGKTSLHVWNSNPVSRDTK